ncbi:hypothetical protein [Streptomyces sp. NPDC087856]|uniref:hypothetical protein n=1 Tax=Streptomyces sp. NPDC087856 TaxID=3365811 RepID=UPI0038095F1B
MGSTGGNDASGERMSRQALVASIGDLSTSGQPASEILHGEDARTKMKESLRAASEVIVCGVASHALVTAIQAMTDEAALNGCTFPWERFVYVTPERTSILANRGESQLGSVVQRWETAQRRMGNCAHHYNQTVVRPIQAGGFEQSSHSGFHMKATKALYLEMTMLVRDLRSKRWRLWDTVGPTKDHGDDVYVTMDERHPAYASACRMVHQLLKESRELATRQVLCAPLVQERADSVNRTAAEQFAEVGSQYWPVLKINTLVPHGTILSNYPTCLPTAICVVRSAHQNQEILLLKKRTAANSTDDLGKLSLLSSRVLEEEVANALGIPLAEGKSAREALDEMWVANYTINGTRGPLTVPQNAFIRAAQRELFFSCGLDLTEDRFAFRGCQVIDREGTSEQIFFCIFEVVLFRRGNAPVARGAADELSTALAWNKDKLTQVAQESLYDREHRGRLNRLLVRREDWLRDTIFSQPFNALPDRGAT